MILRFSEGASRALDELEQDPQRADLFNEVLDAIEFVAKHPDSAEARRRMLRTPRHHTVWLVPVRNRVGSDPWAVLWHFDGQQPEIAYIGPEDFGAK